jgi:hypothetical protein
MEFEVEDVIYKAFPNTYGNSVSFDTYSQEQIADLVEQFKLLEEDKRKQLMKQMFDQIPEEELVKTNYRLFIKGSPESVETLKSLLA